MKKSQLRNIIKEEISKILDSGGDDIKREISKMKSLSDYGYFINSDGSTVSVEGKYAGKEGEYTRIKKDAFSGIVGAFNFKGLTSSGMGKSVASVKLNNPKLILTKIQ